MKCSLQSAHRLAAALGGVAILATVLMRGAFGWDSAPAPFVWLDVALVALVAALPLAASLVVAALGKLPWRSSSLAVICLEAIILVFLPRLYIHARCQFDIEQAVQLSEQSRYGEASTLLQRVLLLEPHAQWRGQPVALLAARTAEAVSQLQERVARPLAPSATVQERIDRAGQLAMLGQTRDAIGMLIASPALANSPDAWNLLGTIYESQDEWQAALPCYNRVRSYWQSLPGPTPPGAGLVHAVRGIAYCQRKLGNLNAAEAAWQEFLALAPSAESHFLLAQFYEDTQQAALARQHAHAAMALDPARYGRAGRRLVEKLVTSQFGCVGAFLAQSPTAAPAAAHKQHAGAPK